MADNSRPALGSITTGDLSNVQDVVIGNNIRLTRNTNLIQPAAVPHFFHQLPPPPANFTGREELINQLCNDFQTHKGKAITGLIGMGGIGKTALGLVFANQIVNEYPDAQIFLDLKGTTTPLRAMEIMRRVILSFEPTADLEALDETGMADAYRSVLYGKRALLFFDNARSAEQIAPLRPPETCTLLITSRWTLPVAGMQNRRVDLMSEDDSVRLLAELCGRIGSQASELAKACAYLPLALRIAGSFLQVNEEWRIEKYIARLGNRKQRLQTLHKSREDAELTTEPDMLATFELSYAQLAKDDQKYWRTLGVFPGSFDAKAAQAIWGLDEDETVRLLSLLRRYSLLEYDAVSLRYSLHDLLADYACSQMQKEEEQEARFKHASYYKDMLVATDRLYLEGDEKVLVGLRLFDLEWENIRTGYAWVVNTKEKNVSLAKLCMEYSNSGAAILVLRQHPRERISWLDTALSFAREIGDLWGVGKALGNLGNAYRNLGETRKAIDFHEQRLAVARDLGDQRGEGIALGNLANAYLDLGETRKALELYEQDLEISREIGDRRGEGYSLGGEGAAYAALGEARKAIEFHEQFLLISREIGDQWGEGYALSGQGEAYATLGEARKAIEFYEQALVIDREISDRRGEGQDLCSLGNAYADLGEARKAIEFHEKSLVIAREVGDRRGEANAIGGLGIAYLHLSETRKAIEFFEQDLTISHEIGNRRGEATIFNNLGLAYTALDESRRAIEFYERALGIHLEIGNRQGEKITLGNLGNVYKSLGETRKAIEYHEQALVVAREIGDKRNEGIWLNNLGYAYKSLGETCKANECYERYLKITREIGNRRGEAAVLGNLGNAYMDLGETSKAIEYYEQQLVITREIVDRQWEEITLGNLGNGYLDLGEIRKAIEYYEQTLIVAREIGDRQNEDAALGNLGNAYMDLGETSKAIEYYEHQLIITREIGDLPGEGNALYNMSLALYNLNEKNRAVELATQARAIYEAIESPTAERACNTLKEWGTLPDDKSMENS
jgi:tetratricopeptide (TPR) repeat protein